MTKDKHHEEEGQEAHPHNQTQKTGAGQTRSATATPTAAADQPVVPMDVGSEGVRVEGVEQPTVVSLTPDTAVSGDPKDIVMVVEGTGFHPKSVIMFAGHDEPTKFIDTTHVSTGVKPSLFVNPDVCQVAVRNAGFPASNEMPFTFTADAPATLASKKR
jgi:hypothetical protein